MDILYRMTLEFEKKKSWIRFPWLKHSFIILNLWSNSQHYVESSPSNIFCNCCDDMVQWPNAVTKTKMFTLHHTTLTLYKAINIHSRHNLLQPRLAETSNLAEQKVNDEQEWYESILREKSWPFQLSLVGCWRGLKGNLQRNILPNSKHFVFCWTLVKSLKNWTLKSGHQTITTGLHLTFSLFSIKSCQTFKLLSSTAISWFWRQLIWELMASWPKLSKFGNRI